MNAPNTNTPGPWEAVTRGDGTLWIYPTNGSTVYDSREPEVWPLSPADARLIAASPTMKALIEEYVAGIGSICGANNREAKFLEDIEDKARAILKTLA